MVYLSPEKEKEMRTHLKSLYPSRDSERFHRVLGYAFTVLGYQGTESPIVAFNRRTLQEEPIEDIRALQKFDPNVYVFRREEEYTKKDSKVQVITVYLTGARVKGKKASLWYIIANSNLGITRSTMDKSSLSTVIKGKMKGFKTREERLECARIMTEAALEDTIIKGGNGTYYLSFTDIADLVNSHKA
ncbi:hypothetical protein HYT57_02240 [Candidatus Woesearchaeota archaeon]|nr:hypothetical protein [Candidatus Woesearchaeota archaeon]